MGRGHLTCCLYDVVVSSGWHGWIHVRIVEWDLASGARHCRHMTTHGLTSGRIIMHVGHTLFAVQPMSQKLPLIEVLRIRALLDDHPRQWVCLFQSLSGAVASFSASGCRRGQRPIVVAFVVASQLLMLQLPPRNVIKGMCAPQLDNCFADQKCFATSVCFLSP